MKVGFAKWMEAASRHRFGGLVVLTAIWSASKDRRDAALAVLDRLTGYADFLFARVASCLVDGQIEPC